LKRITAGGHQSENLIPMELGEGKYVDVKNKRRGFQEERSQPKAALRGVLSKPTDEKKSAG